jgi:hypothetical protein
VATGPDTYDVIVSARCPGCSETLIGFTSYIYYDGTELDFGTTSSNLAAGWAGVQSVVDTDNAPNDAVTAASVVNTGAFIYQDFDEFFTGTPVGDTPLDLFTVSVTDLTYTPPSDGNLADGGRIFLASANEVALLQYTNQDILTLGVGYNVLTMGAQAIDILPITLVKFKAEKSNRSTVLNWNTSSEINSSHFEVERSSDGQTWSYIGQVDAKGYSNTNEKYTYTDKNVYNSRGTQDFHYRLKMFDKDEKFEISNIETVRFSNNSLAKNQIKVYPNPSTDGVNIEFSNEMITQPNEVLLFDLSGRLVYSQQIAEDADYTYIDFMIAKVESGSYLVQFMANDLLVGQEKIIVQQ